MFAFLDDRETGCNNWAKEKETKRSYLNNKLVSFSYIEVMFTQLVNRRSSHWIIYNKSKSTLPSELKFVRTLQSVERRDSSQKWHVIINEIMYTTISYSSFTISFMKTTWH